jgi:hypothetical protein
MNMKKAPVLATMITGAWCLKLFPPPFLKSVYMKSSSLKTPFKYILAVILLLFGVFLMLGGLINMFPDNAPPNITPSDVFMFVTLGIAPCVIGIILWLRTSKQRKEEARDTLESEILHLANRFHHKLTASDVAIKLVLTPKQAEECLEDLVIKGWARLEISDSGVAVYHFHSLLSGEEKESATEV